MARCRRHPEKYPSPVFVRRVGRRAVPGPVRGGVFYACVSRWFLFFVLRSDEISASASGVVPPVHVLMRGSVMLYAGVVVVQLVAVAPGHQHRGWFSRP